MTDEAADQELIEKAAKYDALMAEQDEATTDNDPPPTYLIDPNVPNHKLGPPRAERNYPRHSQVMPPPMAFAPPGQRPPGQRPPMPGVPLEPETKREPATPEPHVIEDAQGQEAAQRASVAQRMIEETAPIEYDPKRLKDTEKNIAAQFKQRLASVRRWFEHNGMGTQFHTCLNPELIAAFAWVGCRGAEDREAIRQEKREDLSDFKHRGHSGLTSLQWKQAYLSKTNPPLQSDELHAMEGAVLYCKRLEESLSGNANWKQVAALYLNCGMTNYPLTNPEYKQILRTVKGSAMGHDGAPYFIIKAHVSLEINPEMAHIIQEEEDRDPPPVAEVSLVAAKKRKTTKKKKRKKRKKKAKRTAEGTFQKLSDAEGEKPTTEG